MTELGTSRRYRPDPANIGQPESWGQGHARATLAFDSIVVCVAGEIDAHNARHLTSYLERHSDVTSRFYLDLREVTFFAAAGLAVLRRVQHQFDSSGADWRLLAGPVVRKLLRICDAADLLQRDTLDDGETGHPARAAMAGLGPAANRLTPAN